MPFFGLIRAALVLAALAHSSVQGQDRAAGGQASVGGLLATTPSSAAPASLDPELDAMHAELGRLATSAAYKDAVVQDAVDQGRRAVLQVARALAEGDGPAAARKKKLVEAALALARRAAARLEEERAEAAAAQAAKHAAEARAQAAVVLERARERLAQLKAEEP